MSEAAFNIWSLPKEQNIKALLLLLSQKVGIEHFGVTEELLPESAVRIIPITEPVEVAVFIYTYAQPAGYFGVDLEYPQQIEKYADDQTERLNELTEEQALEIIISHLELAL